MTPNNELSRVILDRAERLFKRLEIKQDRISILMDLDYVDEMLQDSGSGGMDFRKLASCDDFTFSHDILGILNNFNRETRKMDLPFLPRCAY